MEARSEGAVVVALGAINAGARHQKPWDRTGQDTIVFYIQYVAGLTTRRENEALLGRRNQL